MAYEIIEQKLNTFIASQGERTMFVVIDPHPTHPVVDSTHYNRADAEEALAEIKRDEAIADSFDGWLHAAADEHGKTADEIRSMVKFH